MEIIILMDFNYKQPAYSGSMLLGRASKNFRTKNSQQVHFFRKQVEPRVTLDWLGGWLSKV